MGLYEIKEEYADNQGFDNWIQFQHKILKYATPEEVEDHYYKVHGQHLRAKLEEAAERNYEKYREYSDLAQKEDITEYNVIKLNNLARGFKYAAKSITETPLD